MLLSSTAWNLSLPRFTANGIIWWFVTTAIYAEIPDSNPSLPCADGALAARLAARQASFWLFSHHFEVTFTKLFWRFDMLRDEYLLAQTSL